MSNQGSVEITRKARFCAAHRYHRKDWSEEKNREVFGACNNPHGHGHNYELEATLRGPVDPLTGMVINLRQVDEILQEQVVSRFDHRHINEEIEGFADTIPTTENLVLYIWKLLEPEFNREGVRLARLRLREDAFLYAEYYGEET